MRRRRRADASVLHECNECPNAPRAIDLSSASTDAPLARSHARANVDATTAPGCLTNARDDSSIERTDAARCATSAGGARRSAARDEEREAQKYINNASPETPSPSSPTEALK